VWGRRLGWFVGRGGGGATHTHRTEPAVSLCYYHDASHPSLPLALDENLCYRPREVIRRQAVMGSAEVDATVRVTLAQRLLGLPAGDALWAPDAVPVPPDARDRLLRRFRTMSTFLRPRSALFCFGGCCNRPKPGSAPGRSLSLSPSLSLPLSGVCTHPDRAPHAADVFKLLNLAKDLLLTRIHGLDAAALAD
jgi:hypothetical protein